MARTVRPRFVITLEPLPPPADGDEVPVAVRLRTLLKVALRSLRLRCTAVEQLGPPAAGGPHGGAPP
jgi:hypothetical protein